ncbi:MAG TPA: aldolase/citrate lyase family protein [Gemmatimonadales bacterium]
MDANGQPRPNRLKRDLAAGKVCIGATLAMNSSVVAEILARVGFDWLWLEMEHTALTEENILQMLQATNGADVSTVVRVPWNDKTLIKRAVDAGPDGILVPQINTAEEAEYAVRAMKYPPVGERGAGMARAQGWGLGAGEYYRTANDEIMTLFMIEHYLGVENIDEILATPGLDSVMIGALDLSGSMNLLGQTDHPDVEGAVQKVLAASKMANIPCGIVALDPDHANMRIEQGFTNITVAMDVLMLIGEAKAVIGKVSRARQPELVA